jgi:hypothetical protein
MNSFLKQNIDSQGEAGHEDYILVFEKHLADATDLSAIELLMKKLQFLGLNFDPFDSEVSAECQDVMTSIGIAEHLRNPYLATNILLRLLDKTEERINQLKQ